MALDVKKILTDTIIAMSREKSLKKITINDLVQKTGMGRQTFYNHFSCKEDLIIYAYFSRTVWNVEDVDNFPNFYQFLLRIYQLFAENACFYTQAHKLLDPNLLTNSLQKRLVEFFTDYITSHFGGEVINEELIYIIEFFSYGAVNTLEKWHLKPNSLQPEVRARYIINCMPDALRKHLPIFISLNKKDSEWQEPNFA